MLTFAFEMVTLRFKTNINCASCVRMVRPVLDSFPGIESWVVHTEMPDKLLDVKSETLSIVHLQEALAELGFEATRVI